MPASYEVTARAQDDLFEIWQRIAEDSVDLATRIERDFHELFASLARMPRLGHARPDLTRRPVLFFPLHSFLVIYDPGARPLLIVAVLRGRRNLRHVLKSRL